MSPAWFLLIPTCKKTRLNSKDPGPEGPALVHPVGIIWVITFTSCVQVSGVRCQQTNSTRRVGIAHEMDFLSPLLVFSCNQISVQEPVFTDT